MPIEGTRRWIAWVAAATSLAVVASLGAEQSRISVGESIRVESGETLREATCIACSIYVDGAVEEGALVVLGTLQNRGSVLGNATVIGGTLDSSGPVQGRTVVIGGNMRLLAEIGGDAIAVLGSIEAASPNVAIGGDAVTVLGRQSGISQGAVEGSIRNVGAEQLGRRVVSGALAGLAASLLAVFGALLALNTVAFLTLGTNRLRTIGSTLDGNLPACFLCGLGSCLFLAVLALAVAILLPAFLPVIAVFALLSVVGYSGITYRIGGNLFPRLSPVVATQSAAALLIAIQLVPVIGWLILLAVWSIAVGAAVLSGLGTSPDWLARRAGSRARTGLLKG